MFVQLLDLIRILFPKWSFFDQLGYRFHLKFRESDSSKWTFVHFESPGPSVLKLFFNPTHNLTLAQISAIEQFSREVQINDPENANQLDSFKLVKAITEFYIEKYFSSVETFQFKIEAHSKNSKVDLYTSAWLKKEPL